MADGINYTGDLSRYVLYRLFDNLTGQILLKCWRSKQCRFASNNYSREQFKISTDNRSIFDRVCDVGNWESWGIPEYSDDAIRTVNKRHSNDFICASLSLLIILLSKYYYVPIRKIKLCCWNMWRSRFSYKVAGNAVLSGHSAASL